MQLHAGTMYKCTYLLKLRISNNILGITKKFVHVDLYYFNYAYKFLFPLKYVAKALKVVKIYVICMEN